MECPECGGNNFSTLETRQFPDRVYRRRQCKSCLRKVSTAEIIVAKIEPGIRTVDALEKELDIRCKKKLQEMLERVFNEIENIPPNSDR